MRSWPMVDREFAAESYSTFTLPRDASTVDRQTPTQVIWGCRGLYTRPRCPKVSSPGEPATWMGLNWDFNITSLAPLSEDLEVTYTL